MKPFISVTVFLTLMVSSLFAGIYNYRMVEERIVADMNNALAMTLAEKQDGWITPDTIKTYRNNLSIDALRDKSFISYAVPTTTDSRNECICSDTIMWKSASQSFAFRGYATCSFITMLGMSNQRTSILLSSAAVLWALISLVYFQKKQRYRTENLVTLGTLSFSCDSRSFYNTEHEQMKLTPMQQKLMEMFFASKTHKLSKEDICKCLWPKKDDASETLYALIKRLKPIIEENSNLKIEAERGKAYKLKEKE